MKFANAIVGYLRDKHIDLIIIGTRGGLNWRA